MIENQILPPNVYVVTSASSSATSYACLNDPELGTYVSSCFSRGWIQSIDIHGQNVDFETIYDDTYNYASQMSTIPREYGDLSIKSTTWSAFLKENDSVASSISSMNEDPDDMSSQISGPYVASTISSMNDDRTDLNSQISGPYVVIIEIEEGTELNDVSEEELLELISSAVKIEREQLKIVIERDEKGNVHRIFVYVSDEDSANSVVDLFKQCNDNVIILV